MGSQIFLSKNRGLFSEGQNDFLFVVFRIRIILHARAISLLLALFLSFSLARSPALSRSFARKPCSEYRKPNKKALYFRKRALYIRKRALYIRNRALCEINLPSISEATHMDLKEPYIF